MIMMMICRGQEDDSMVLYTVSETCFFVIWCIMWRNRGIRDDLNRDPLNALFLIALAADALMSLVPLIHLNETHCDWLK
jgi:hypothetical protein